MSNILLLLVLVVDVYALYDCYKSSMTAGKKVLWYLLILIFPLFGVAIYFLIARKKIKP